MAHQNKSTCWPKGKLYNVITSKYLTEEDERDLSLFLMENTNEDGFAEWPRHIMVDWTLPEGGRRMEKELKYATPTGNMDVGTILEKDGKEYILVHWDIIMAGHSKEFGLIRKRNNWFPKLRWVKNVYDNEIRLYKIVKLMEM